eukprot:SAG11_NODE_5950_length_1426_cov_1.836473_2_plen_53_part_00
MPAQQRQQEECSDEAELLCFGAVAETPVRCRHGATTATAAEVLYTKPTAVPR